MLCIADVHAYGRPTPGFFTMMGSMPTGLPVSPSTLLTLVLTFFSSRPSHQTLCLQTFGFLTESKGMSTCAGLIPLRNCATKWMLLWDPSLTRNSGASSGDYVNIGRVVSGCAAPISSEELLRKVTTLWTSPRDDHNKLSPRTVLVLTFATPTNV